MLRWITDVSTAAWLSERVHPFGQDTGSIVPEGFEAYARVFHPVTDGQGQPMRWSELAERNGRIVHSGMQLAAISRPIASLRLNDFVSTGIETGSLPPSERRVLVELLRSATGTPDRCWFCIWEGWGSLDDQGVTERVVLPQRKYLLASGPIEEATSSVLPDAWDQSVNLWWPEDRSWIVATEIDFAWTYGGGTRRLVDRILDEPRLEALAVRLEDKPFADSDLLNTGGTSA